MKSLSSILFLFTFCNFVVAQNMTTADQVSAALVQKKQMASNSLVKNVPFENIGPSIMSGRVVDLAVNPDKPTEFYVAYASGGLWYTNNNGTTFTPVLDNSDTQNIGDIAVHWPSGTIYVGTGENNSSRSSYAGIGILKSTDNGANWTNIGLGDSHHIGRILVDPNDPNVLVVGVTGHLYTPNTERGIYKSVDGGKTWSQKLYVDDTSGIIDMSANPNNFNTMFASSWTKDRKAWNFNGSGANSHIFKSTDAGETWQKVTTKDSGFPIGDGTGRIGLAVYDENTVYAIHDSQFRRASKGPKNKSNDLSKDDFKQMSVSDLMKFDNTKLDKFLKSNRFPSKYTSSSVKALIKSGKAKPIDLAIYLEDANSLLFDTPVIGAEVYKSTDGGKTWDKTHDDYLDGVYFSYGYYFGHIYVSPKESDHIYIYGVPILKSKNGGKTFESINGENVHSDHHALWINPNDPNHLINGNDGGVNITYDDGENWIKNNAPSVGQFYAINVDNEEPYHVYGGLQDNGVWVGAHNASEDKSWHQQGQYPWEGIMGGDGMQVQIDNRNSDIVYTGYQFGNYFRINRETGDFHRFNIRHELGERPYRFNWQTPILLSPHNQDIIYLGGNKLMRSMNQGDTWEAISDDLTNGGKKGNVAYGTISTISESNFQFGLIYSGSDDGKIYVTKDAGGLWEDISSSLPQNLWVSRVQASKHKKERVYVTLNGYRNDDFKVYVFKSEDYGKNWESISNGIPLSPVNVILEDPSNENLLFVGTDNGLYTSFNQGDSWEIFVHGLPNVAVHDLVIQEREKHLLVGTHGRSIYKADISHLQNISANSLSNGTTLFEGPSISHSRRWGSSFGQWYSTYEPSTSIVIYSNTNTQADMKVLSSNEVILNTMNVTLDKGFNYVSYDLTMSEQGKSLLESSNSKVQINNAQNGKIYLPKGTYEIKVGNESTKLIIE